MSTFEPGERDATRTVERLLAALDRDDVVHALDRKALATVIERMQREFLLTEED